MEDTRITFETAKLAKEKGCDLENCTCGGYPECICSDKRISQSLLAKWLRKEHSIYIELLIDGWSYDDCVTDDFLCYRCFIWKVGKPRPKHNEDLGAAEYEKMFEIGLQEALKLI